MDNPLIGNFMLLWLVVTTQMGYKNGMYSKLLIANAHDEQADLAKQLNLPTAVVAQVCSAVASNPTSFQNVASQFHTLARNAFTGIYDGSFCPLDTSALQKLVPAADVGNKEPKK